MEVLTGDHQLAGESTLKMRMLIRDTRDEEDSQALEPRAFAGRPKQTLAFNDSLARSIGKVVRLNFQGSQKSGIAATWRQRYVGLGQGRG